MFYSHPLVSTIVGSLEDLVMFVQSDLDELDDACLDELIRTVRDAKRLLKETTSAHGFNVGMNFGRCAGAGLPGHLHVHIVPRWDGDTNFMPVIGSTAPTAFALTY